MIIAISGLHGTGKSTVSKKIAELFGLRYFSTGEMFRELANDKNLSLEELSKLAEEDIQIDFELDKKIEQHAKEGNCVLDNQLSPYLLGDIIEICILLKCNKSTRISRMMDRDSQDYERKLKETEIREESERKRFIEYYGVDILETNMIMGTFDLIVDTTNLDIEGTVNVTQNAINEFKRCKILI